MQATTFDFERPDGLVLFVYRWLPNGSAKAVVQVAHGWGEHAGRYARVAEALCREGYAVYANDHRGHGRTARTPAELGFFAERPLAAAPAHCGVSSRRADRDATRECSASSSCLMSIFGSARPRAGGDSLAGLTSTGTSSGWSMAGRAFRRSSAAT